MMVSFLIAPSYWHPNPCRNNGYCYEKGATFECSCEFGFKGPTCAGKFIVYYTAKKKWRFPLRISSANVTKPAGNCGFGHVFWRSP